MSDYIKVVFESWAKPETLWVKRENYDYVLDNIPFFARGYAWLDVIHVKKSNCGRYYAAGVVQMSTNSTIRIALSNNFKIESICKEIEKKWACRYEGAPQFNIIAVSVPKNVFYPKFKHYLEQGEKEKKWDYDEGRISHVHRKQLEAAEKANTP